MFLICNSIKYLATLREQSQVASSTGVCLDFLCCKDPGGPLLSNSIRVLLYYTYTYTMQLFVKIQFIQFMYIHCLKTKYIRLNIQDIYVLIVKSRFMFS